MKPLEEPLQHFTSRLAFFRAQRNMSSLAEHQPTGSPGVWFLSESVRCDKDTIRLGLDYVGLTLCIR